MRHGIMITLALFVAGCGGSPVVEVDDLKAFLSGVTPSSDDPAELDRLNGLFAAQSVRARGYLENGQSPEALAEEGWSPVVFERDGSRVAADVAPWLESGTLDGRGRFSPPLPENAPGVAPLPLGSETLADADLRAGRVLAALKALDGSVRTLEWTPASAEAVRLGGDGVAHVNPRLLHLVPGAAPAVAAVEPAIRPAGTSRQLDRAASSVASTLQRALSQDVSSTDPAGDCSGCASCATCGTCSVAEGRRPATGLGSPSLPAWLLPLPILAALVLARRRR